MSTPDYSGEQTPPSEDAMTRLRALVQKQIQAQVKLLQLEAQVEEAQNDLKQLSEGLIPELMDELGIKELRVSDSGASIEVFDAIRASFPSGDSIESKHKQKAAFEYLQKTGNDGLVKRQFTVSYGRDEQQWALDFAERLQEMGIEEHATVEQKNTIHHQTLVAFIREELKEGRPIPLESFGAYVQRQTKIKLPR